MSATASAALLLDGRVDDDPTLALIHDALADGLAAGGWAVDDWRLRDDRIAWCAGCFKCWTTTPGVCAHADRGREVASRWVRSDLVVAGTVPAGRAGGPEARTFRRLVERNTLNMQPPRWSSGVLESGANEWDVRLAVSALLDEVGVRPARDAVHSAPSEVVA